MSASLLEYRIVLATSVNEAQNRVWPQDCISRQTWAQAIASKPRRSWCDSSDHALYLNVAVLEPAFAAALLKPSSAQRMVPGHIPLRSQPHFTPSNLKSAQPAILTDAPQDPGTPHPSHGHILRFRVSDPQTAPDTQFPSPRRSSTPRCRRLYPSP